MISRSLVGLSIVLAMAGAALYQASTPAHASRPVPQSVLPTARCALRAADASTHARALEQSALLHWQRAPFELEEAERALRLIAEAECCYRAAGDRSGVQRAASRMRSFEAARRGVAP